tara:strand:- start:21547 stop:21894 length:348 start_codon:yes stop_codon:yes gene_type:complete
MASILTIKVSGNAGCQADVYVARYEVYPNVDPTGVCVGFRTVCTPNGLSGYWDTVVPNADIKEGDDPNTIAGYAWNGVTDSITGLKDTIVPWAETEMVKSTIIGEQFAKIEEDGE